MTIPTPPDLPQDIRPPLMTNKTKDSDLAIASLITGILGWILIPVLGSLAAVITGHLAYRDIKDSNGTLTGKGMATAGLILGYIQIGFIVLAIIAVIVALTFLAPVIRQYMYFGY